MPRVPSLSQLLVATTNPGKVREIRRVLDGVGVEIFTLADVASIAEPEETGRTFTANARLKAAYYAEASGLPTVAEDSGLVIDAIGGRPGVESARYPGATYPDKFANLERELAPHARPWSGRFVCALAFVDQAVTYDSSGVVEGEIVLPPRGANGFGYDPIFFYRPFNCTLGEATDEQKLTVSHRGQAFRQFRRWLANR